MLALATLEMSRIYLMEKLRINTIEHRHAYRPYKTLLAKMLQQRRGRIFNIVNTRAFQTNPNVLANDASKAYVLHYSE